jgi:hypothetical protein
MKARQFEIDRAPGDLSFETFQRDYYAPQKPVVLEGFAKKWPARERWTPEYLRNALQSSQATQSLWWYELSGNLLAEDYQPPAWLQQLGAQREVRLWISRKGTVTPWHFDGYSLQIINIQISGRKHFGLVSPETPLPYAPFWFESLLGEKPPERALSDHHIFTEFVLEPGDAVFMPQHWAHYVESLEPVNVSLNLNWFDAEMFERTQTALGVRERESVACMYLGMKMLDQLWNKTKVGSSLYRKLRSNLHYYLRDYGNVPRYAIAKQVAPEQSTQSLLRRATRELPQLPMFLRLLRERAKSDLAKYGTKRTPQVFFDTEAP